MSHILTMDHAAAGHTSASSAAGSNITITKKRGFDIASLVDPDYKSSSLLYQHNNNNNNNNITSHCVNNNKKRKSASSSSASNETPHERNNNNSISMSNGLNGFSLSNHLKLEGLAAQLANIHSFPHLQSFPTGPTGNPIHFPPAPITSSPTTSSSFSSSTTTPTTSGNMYVPSAFKKVDKHLNGSTPSSMMSSSQSTLPFVLSSLYNMPSSRGQMPPALFAPPTSRSQQSLQQQQQIADQVTASMMAATGQQHSQMIPTSLPSNASSGLTSGGSNGKSVVPASLLPFLPPSLAALSFPQTNWCAKCNATFRMTSDLVYHMRSHHKPSGAGDPIKKKREEKLRCNICGETFRERHHLTRHMTSHQ